MAKTPTVTTITSGYASNTQLNANFTALRDAFANTLSLDGSTPNAMGADLDLNNNDILNVNALEVQSLRSNGQDLDLSGVATLAPISAEIVTLAQLQDGTVLLYGLSELHAVKDQIVALAPIAGDITTVSGIDTEVTTVSGLSSQITTVSGIASDVTTVAGLSSDITTVVALQPDITSLLALSTEITTVSGISADVTTVAGLSSNISTVVSISSDITAVAGIAPDVTVVAANVSGIANFADKYVVSATEPVSPTEGMLWYDTSTDIMKVYNGSSFQSAGSSVNGTAERNTYTATSGQTTFAATYDAGYVDVYLNGVKLVAGTDFTATNGSSIVLATGAALNDVVDIVAYGTFELADVYTKVASDARYTRLFTPIVVATSTNANANTHYYLNGSAITLTLPASPAVGDEVRVSESAGNTNCVIGRNGSNIMGAADNLTIDAAYAVIYLRYVNATIGWAFS